jgi:glucose/arabinose dehydrogenase
VRVRSGNSVNLNSDKHKKNIHKNTKTWAIITLALLALSIFSTALSLQFSSSSFSFNNRAQAITIAKRTDLKTFVPPELASSIINSGPAPSSSNFNITKGYKIEPVLWNVSLPTSTAFDGKGNMFVAEAGAGFGGFTATPRILKIDVNGTISILTDRYLSGPITDLVYHQGKLYVANKGKISTVNPSNGAVVDIISAIPAGGDHATNQIAFGPDGRIYFAQGSATNSGVVGLDNFSPNLGWPYSFPFVHDVPAKDVKLMGQNFEAPNMLADGQKNITVIKGYEAKVTLPIKNKNADINNDKGTGAISGNLIGNATTGAFTAFGNKTTQGQIIKGNVKCNGCILSAKPDGTDLRVAAWGMRLDTFTGLAFDKKGHLLVTDPGAEERGSRPIKNDHDKIWSIDMSSNNNNNNSTSNSSSAGKFYGWPDYFYDGNKDKILKPVTAPQFKSPRGGDKRLSFLLEDSSSEQQHLPKVFADPGYAVKVTQAVINNNKTNFGFQGMAFVGEFGTHAPFTHQFDKPIKMYVPGNTNKTIIGQKVIAVNTTTRNTTDFLSLKAPDASFRPVGLSFSPDGNALYVASIGKTEQIKKLPTGEPIPLTMIWMHPDTGVIWRITRSENVGLVEPPAKNLRLSPELTVTANSGSLPTTSVLNLPRGYKMEPVLWNLNLPSSIAFDDKQNIYVGEEGYAYVGLTPPPRILKIDHNTGNVSVFVDRGLNYPMSDITFHNGKLYVSNGGKISTVDMKGKLENIISALPGIEDHYIDQIVFNPTDKRMYFGVGTATNSGIVGKDNPWVKATPKQHDTPGKNITLAGVNFITKNFISPAPNDNAITGAYVPFNTTTHKGQVIKGDTKCSGCILSANPDGTDVKLVAWGLRHPYGAALTADGKKLVINMNGVDERGSRNVANDGDKIYVIDISNHSNWGKWYGWPDFFGNGLPVTDPLLKSPLNNQTLKFVMLDHPALVKPDYVADVGTALTQADRSFSDSFGFKDKILMGEFGTFAPQTHLTANSRLGISVGSVMGQTIGQKIVVFDPKTLSLSDFITLNTADGSFRPTGLKFSPDGKSLYIASVGINQVRTITPKGVSLPFPLGQPWAFPRTGIVWKITHG